VGSAIIAEIRMSEVLFSIDKIAYLLCLREALPKTEQADLL
jgi:hypothetical protein